MSVALRVLLLVVLPSAVLVLGLPLYLTGLGGMPDQAALPPAPNIIDSSGDLSITVYWEDDERLELMPLERYVEGVVAAEMPAAFPMEALKAQAVVARTYALRRMRLFGGPGCSLHPAADVCNDPGTGQAYADEAELQEKWGDDYPLYRSKVAQAVEETRGLILTYDGAPIDAVYHSTSGGMTASAQEVWGQEVPYLSSVPSPYEERSPRLEQTLSFTPAELVEKLRLDRGVVAAITHQGAGLFNTTRTASGRLKELKVGDQAIDGQSVRQRLGLNSTMATFHYEGDQVVVKVRGFGHGVGMSQYGADGMARRGSSYQAILAHYYPGAQLRPIFID